MVAEAVRQGLTNQDACRATGIHVASPEIPSTVEAMSCRCGGKYSEFLECPNARARESIKKTYENQISRQPFAGADTPTRGGCGEPNKT